jgi:hypothetical protein
LIASWVAGNGSAGSKIGAKPFVGVNETGAGSTVECDDDDELGPI